MVGKSQLLLLACLGLAGCAGVQTPEPVLPIFPGDNESVASEVTGSATRGVVVLDAGIEGLQCSESRVVLARADASGYIAAREVVLPTTYAGRAAIEAVELQPGTYHIVHYTCRNGAHVTYAGTSADAANIPWTGKTWPQSLASFSVGPGEVIDAGRLSLKRTGGGIIKTGKKKGKKGFAVASVAALTPEAVARLQTERPELAERMKPQAMALAPAAAEIRVGRCHLTAGGSEATPKNEKKKTAIGAGMVSTSFSGPVAPMTDCIEDGGKSDQFKALVGNDDATAAPNASQSGQ
jgi:hypothetical protein